MLNNNNFKNAEWKYVKVSSDKLGMTTIEL